MNYPIPGHETHSRKIYINPLGEQVRTETREGRVYYSYPEGTIIVKEIYPSLELKGEEKPIMLTTMIKDSRNPLSRGGWLWVTQQFDTKSEKVIDYEFCFDCHSNANERHPYGDENPDNEYRDYVFFPYQW